MNYSGYTDKEVAADLESARMRLKSAEKEVTELENEQHKRGAQEVMKMLGFEPKPKTLTA